MKQIYLDTNIFVTHFSDDGTEEVEKICCDKFLERLSKSVDVEFLTSAWTITEMANVLVSKKRMDPAKVTEIENDLIRGRRLGDIKFKLVDVGDKDYDFNELFLDIRKRIINYDAGVGDSIHSIIMKNNKIEIIITTDQRGFDKIPQLIVLNPVQIILSELGLQDSKRKEEQVKNL